MLSVSNIHQGVFSNKMFWSFPQNSLKYIGAEYIFEQFVEKILPGWQEDFNFKLFRRVQ